MNKEKLVCLESIRGLAALVVVIHHLEFTFMPVLKADYATLSAHPFWIRALGLSPLSVFSNGGFAVRLFFVLSGFVLSLSFFRTLDREVVASAAVRRYFRLMIPSAIVVLIAWALLQVHAYGNVEAAQMMAQPAGAWLYKWFQFDMSFLTALKQGVWDNFAHYSEAQTLNSNLWTMPVELAGSFVVFVILAVFGASTRRALVYAGLAVTFHLMHNRNFSDFLCGLIVCDVYVALGRAGKRPNVPWTFAWIALGLGLMLGGLSPDWLAGLIGTRGAMPTYWGTAGAALIISSALFCEPMRRFLEHRFLAFLGRISFPLYLIHFSVICSAGSWGYVALRHAGVEHVAAALACSALSIAVSILAAWGLVYCADIPGIEAGRWVDRLLRPEASQKKSA